MTKLILSLIAGIVSLLSVANCFGEDIGTHNSSTKAILLNEYRQMTGRSEELFSLLKDWNAFPPWAVEQRNHRVDWLKTLHENVTREAWPDELKDAVAGIIAGRNERLAVSTPGTHRFIGIFDTTPVYLAQLVEVVIHPLVLPGSPDLHAAMKFDPDREVEAIHQLAQVLGMLKETSYLDGPDVVWRPAVILGTRFIYYHELGHLAQHLDNNFSWRFDPYPLELEFSDELYADRFAFHMLMLETRSRPEIQETAMAGIAFAMSLIACQEFVNKKTFRSTKGAVLRMARILYWADLAIKIEKLLPGARRLSESIWRLFKTKLKQIDTVPSPVLSLLRQTADRPHHDWEFARNEIVKWCVFGDCRRVAATFNDACKSAKDQLNAGPGRKILQIVEYIIRETRSLEPSLGFAEHLQGDKACNSTP